MPHDGLNSTTFFWLILITFIVALLARRLRIPYTLTLVVTGLLLGMTRLMPQLKLEPSLLLTVFLPPLLFETAINLPLDALKRDWKPIALYALAGTLISTFIIAGIVTKFLGIPLPYTLVFGALISTTDPIAVIAVFKQLHAGQRLTLLIEAESLFNDGIAVVLFTVMLSLALGAKVSPLVGAGQFLYLVGGGVLLGAALGAAASRIHFELDDHLIEITLTTVVAFGAYLSAVSLHVSGVMAVVSAGIVLRNYGMETGMTQNTRLAVSAFWEYAAFLVNSFVFLLIGIEVVHVDWRDKLGYTFGAILAVLVGRLVIYPLSWVLNFFHTEIPRSWQHILYWGGLRGALSMALVLTLSLDFPFRDTLVAMTFGVVVFSLIFQGVSIGALLKRLGLCVEDVEDNEVREG